MKKPSDTPRTDGVRHNVADLAMHARKFERENNELRREIAELKAKLELVVHFSPDQINYYG